jgi:hypothetical protein
MEGSVQDFECITPVERFSKQRHLFINPVDIDGVLQLIDQEVNTII